MERLTGRVALITGGAGAIGAATARRLSAEGAIVVVADRDGTRAGSVAGDLRQGTPGARAVEVDVTSEASVIAMVDSVVGALGRIDVLFCCAGVLLTGTAMETSLADWERSLAVNLTGPFLASKHVLPVMIAGGRGSIVHMSSSAGLVGEANIAAYCAAKGGVIMLARQMALDVARHGVRVNVICPGWIDTPFNDPAIDAAGGRAALDPFVDMMVPMGRQGSPDEVADVVAFLASDDSRLMTGAVVTVDGGLTAQ
ncbi:MAG TPA: SDR family oxidoreductase [Candidatus Limnocylindrales bacterium]